jgi:quercetin dioxygenase-like cupin family protein
VKIIALDTMKRSDAEVAIFQGFEHGASVSCFALSLSTGKGPKKHRHSYEETFILLEGEIELLTDGTARTIGPGHIAVIPSGVWHEFKVTSATSVSLITVHPVARMVTEWAE